MPRIFLYLPLALFACTLNADQVILDEHSVEHIHFKRINPNTVSYDNGVVHFNVNRSASFLLYAFDEVRPVRTVSFQWKAGGMLNKNSVEQERSRTGDDAWLRVGLILEGQPANVPEPLLPRWMQQVRKTLKHPSNRMVYLIPDAQHSPGTIWKSPFSDDVDMVSVSSTGADNDWRQVDHEFPEVQKAVGLWIMADGDNTHSVFRSQLKNLNID
jgi:hypothetical protein